jgi:hypothetical protein
VYSEVPPTGDLPGRLAAGDREGSVYDGDVGWREVLEERRSRATASESRCCNRLGGEKANVSQAGGTKSQGELGIRAPTSMSDESIDTMGTAFNAALLSRGHRSAAQALPSCWELLGVGMGVAFPSSDGRSRTGRDSVLGCETTVIGP